MAASRAKDELRALSRSTFSVVIVWSLLRLVAFLAASDNFPYPRGAFLGSDVLIFQSWAPGLSHLHFPVHDPRWQYPPGAGIFLTIPQWISQVLTNIGLTFHYDQAFQLVVLLADLALLAVLIWAGRRFHAPASGLSGAWLWALAPLFIGPLIAARFDTVAGLVAVAALILLFTKRPTWAGILMGVGALIKAWPVLMIFGAKRRELPRTALGVVVGAGAVTALGLLWTNSWSFLSNELHRGLQIESVGALPWVISWRFGHPPTYTYAYGALEIVAAHARTVGLAMSLLGLALLLVLAALRVTGRLENVRGVDVAYTALLVSVVTSRVYSPQYDIWLVAVGAAVLLDRRTMLRPAVWFIVAASAFGQLVYPVVYWELTAGQTSGVAIQTLRVLCLLAAFGYSYLKVVRAGLTKTSEHPHQDLDQPTAASIDAK